MLPAISKLKFQYSYIPQYLLKMPVLSLAGSDLTQSISLFMYKSVKSLLSASHVKSRKTWVRTLTPGPLACLGYKYGHVTSPGPQLSRG